MTTINVKTEKLFFFHFFVVGFVNWGPGSGMETNSDLGSGVNIPDPPDWFYGQFGSSSGSCFGSVSRQLKAV